MTNYIPAHELKALLDRGASLALLDVREHGEFKKVHLPGAVPLPRRLIEFRLLYLVPCKNTHLVLYDDDTRRASLAASTLERMGYSKVKVLEGGLNRWEVEGYPLDLGTYVDTRRSAARVAEKTRMPGLTPHQLQRRI